MRMAIPQLAGDRIFLTDGGLETCLIFHRGIELPAFAAFTLYDSADGRDELRDYFVRVHRARPGPGRGVPPRHGTWRANADWGAQLGYDADALDRSTARPSRSPASCATRPGPPAARS